MDSALNRSIEKCLNMKPEYSSNSKIISVKDIRSNLNRMNIRKSNRIVNKNLKVNSLTTDRARLQDSLREISEDIQSLHGKIEVLFTTMDSVLDKLEGFEKRIEVLENIRTSNLESRSS